MGADSEDVAQGFGGMLRKAASVLLGNTDKNEEALAKAQEAMGVNSTKNSKASVEDRKKGSAEK